MSVENERRTTGDCRVVNVVKSVSTDFKDNFLKLAPNSIILGLSDKFRQHLF